MLRKTVILVSFLFAFTSCSKLNAPKKPKDLISKDKMVAILIDSRLIASASAVNKEKMEEGGVDIENYVFTKHNIDSLQFALSNNYYAFFLKEYEDIYAKVEDSLERLKKVIKDQEEQEEKERLEKEKDSIEQSLKVKDSLPTIKKSPLKKGLVKEALQENGLLIESVSDKNPQ